MALLISGFAIGFFFLHICQLNFASAIAIEFNRSITLDEFLKGELSPKSFNGTWLNGWYNINVISITKMKLKKRATSHFFVRYIVCILFFITDNEILYNGATGNLTIFRINNSSKVTFPVIQGVRLFFNLP